ncbi:hypothetical protein B0I00_0080 [Novosphingobium kunmingense]|uniref:Uncharacterized protein n=1 Tax=Novosphingobium kunmingense TaxID=1211806 RepID=A0A2N0I183_9SPHN|nr:hypothetical protein [Novosphingobium kunmingense]PKB24901.1 hypothetical protein B0I00_0080 [Novosphingobium kunmingense]
MTLARIGGLAALAAGLIAVPALASHSWGSYHWANSSGPVDLTINVSVTSQWTSSVSTAISDWQKSSNLALTPQDSTANRKRCSAISGQILVCNEAYGPRGWLGIASITTDSRGHIKSGTTKLNDTYFASGTYNTPAWRALVACQEIGHDFGLAHQDENFGNPNLGTCMDYTSNPSTNQHPNQHDYDQLAAIYNHFDTYSTSSAAVATNFGIRDLRNPRPAAEDLGDPGDSPADWGRSVHDDAKGRPDVFVMDLPGGGRRITHVFWTLEVKRSEIHHD